MVECVNLCLALDSFLDVAMKFEDPQTKRRYSRVAIACQDFEIISKFGFAREPPPQSKTRTKRCN
jgi:hypothetical protein